MDIDILLALQGFRESTGGLLDGFFNIIRYFGEPEVVMIVGALLFWCVSRRAGEYMLFNFALGGWLNQLLKISFCVYRPWIRDPRVVPQGSGMQTATGYSFPSGHVTNASALLGSLTVTLRKKKAAAATLIVLWVLLAFSRNYMGVHTPQDTLVSFALGILTLWIVSKALAWAEGRPAREAIVAATGVVLSIGLAIYAAVKPYPMDYDASSALLVDPAKMTLDAFKMIGISLGFFIGWYIQRRFITFSETAGTPAIRILRGAAGVVLLLAVYKLGGMAVAWMGDAPKCIISSALPILFILAIYPAILGAIQRKSKVHTAA